MHRRTLLFRGSDESAHKQACLHSPAPPTLGSPTADMKNRRDNVGILLASFGFFFQFSWFIPLQLWVDWQCLS